MAMGLFQAKIKSEAGLWRIGSAGVWAEEGLPAATNTKLVVHKRGIDLSSHRSTRISSELLEEYALILVMEKWQRDALRSTFPIFSDKVFQLSEMAHKNGDIIDPIGHPLLEFEATAREIEIFLNQGFDQISQLSSKQ